MDISSAKMLKIFSEPKKVLEVCGHDEETFYLCQNHLKPLTFFCTKPK